MMSQKPDLSSLRAALDRLGAALAQPRTEWTRDAAIQRFEFTFELAWKAAAKFARREGVAAPSPREAFRAAMSLGWIADEPLWLGMLEDRNRTSHTYSERTAEEIYGRLSAYHAALIELMGRLDGLS